MAQLASEVCRKVAPQSWIFGGSLPHHAVSTKVLRFREKELPEEVYSHSPSSRTLLDCSSLTRCAVQVIGVIHQSYDRAYHGAYKKATGKETQFFKCYKHLTTNEELVNYFGQELAKENISSLPGILEMKREKKVQKRK